VTVSSSGQVVSQLDRVEADGTEVDRLGDRKRHDLLGHRGELALAEITKRKPILRNRVAPAIEQAVVELAVEQPAYGQVRVSPEALGLARDFVRPAQREAATYEELR
jgi:hypothetical protein